jgi:PAS domain S-box-containing protein
MAEKDPAWEGEMFRLLAENVQDYALFVVDPQGHVLSWSKGAERLLGFAEAEVLGRPCDCFFTPEDVQSGVARKELDEALRTGRGEDDRWHLRKDGSRFWSSGVVTPLRDEGGRLRGFAKIMRDRTDLKLAVDTARERERRLQLLTDHAPVLIAQCDADRRYTFANKPYATRCGLHPRDLVGRRIRDVLGETAYAAIERHLDAALRGERVEFEVEIPYGGLGPQLMRCAYDPEFDPEGRVRGVVAAYVNVTEARRAGEALRESEERFARFMQHLPGLAWIKDERGHYVYANDAAVDAFGKPRGELYGRADEEVFPPETAARFRENDRKALAGGAGVRVVETLEHGDGVLHHSLVSKFPIPGPDGGPAVVGGMAIDVTEEVRTRAVLEESEERFRATFDQAAVGIAHVGTDGRWLRVNRKLCDIVGYRPDELLTLTFQDITHPDDLAADLAQVRRLLAGEITTYSMEKRYFRKDRSLVWINLTVSLVRTPEGQPKYFISVVEEITEKKRVQDDLARLTAASERRRRLYEAALSNTPDLVYVFDLGHRFTYANEGLLRMWGKAWDEAIGKNCLELGYEAWHAALHDREIEQVIATRQPVKGEVPFTGTFGRRIYEYILVPVVGENGEVEAVAGTTRDVTERKALEGRLRDQAEQLREADRRKDEFLATLAHELRNPLAPLRNGLELLQDARVDPESVQRVRAVMERQVVHMARIVDDLLDVSRITRGKVELRPERVDLARLVRHATEDHHASFGAAGVTMEVDVPEPPVWAEGDPTRLTQVTSNLLDNAGKFTPRGGTVSVRLSADPGSGQAVLTVRDTGAGIEPDMLPRLFEAFVQADRSLDRSRGGLGLGLALVRGLVELHGGEVHAASGGPGRGSEFVVRLPMQPEPAAITGMPEAPARDSRKLRILLVEDNRDAADSLKLLLEIYGHEVALAYTGPAGVQAAKACKPDVILCDIGLPGLDGYGVARQLRADPATAGARMIAVTGYGAEEDRRRSQEAGFDLHMVKPVDPLALREVVARAN